MTNDNEVTKPKTTRAAKRVTTPKAPRARGGRNAATAEPAAVLALPPAPPEPTLDTLTAQRAELQAATAEAERRLTELRREVDEVSDTTEIRQAVAEAREQVEMARGQADDVRRDAAWAADTFREVGDVLAAAKADAESIRTTAAEAERAARTAHEQAADVRESTDAARAELTALREQFDSVGAEARQLIDRLTAAVAEAKAVNPTPVVALPPQEASPRDEPPASNPGPDLPAVDPLPLVNRLPDARNRLVRMLNDARAVMKEEAELLHTLAATVHDAELRAELDRHHGLCLKQQAAIEERVHGLGGDVESGRGFLGQLASRVWDALQTRRGPEDATEVVLQALSAAEFAAGLYAAVYTLARATADDGTAGLVSAHWRHERTFADHLRERIAPTALRTIRRPDAVPA